MNERPQPLRLVPQRVRDREGFVRALQKVVEHPELCDEVILVVPRIGQVICNTDNVLQIIGELERAKLLLLQRLEQEDEDPDAG